jgi:hypothetical protein
VPSEITVALQALAYLPCTLLAVRTEEGFHHKVPASVALKEKINSIQQLLQSILPTNIVSALLSTPVEVLNVYACWSSKAFILTSKPGFA